MLDDDSIEKIALGAGVLIASLTGTLAENGYNKDHVVLDKVYTDNKYQELKTEALNKAKNDNFDSHIGKRQSFEILNKEYKKVCGTEKTTFQNVDNLTPDQLRKKKFQKIVDVIKSGNC